MSKPVQIPPKPTRRVVLLGASNVARGLPVIVETSQQIFGEPLDIMAAIGHGRSFGQESCVLGRKISGIFSSGLWDDFADRPALSTTALLTDVGNDIVYGVPVLTIMGWLERCLDALLQRDAKVVVTELPLASLRTLGSLRFRLMRTILFPFSRLGFSEMFARAEELNARLIRACEDRQIAVFPVKDAWFGFDPIHIRRSYLTSAWPEILSLWVDNRVPQVVPRNSFWLRCYLQTRVPKKRSIGFVKQTRDQPSGRLNDGTLISLY